MTQWTVEQLQRNVHRITFTGIKSGWEGWVMLSSDRHHDSPDNVQWLEKDHLDLAKDRNAPIIDAGDLFDAMGGPGDKRRTYANTKDRHKTDDYYNSLIESATEFYSPYAAQFAMLGIGNHETAPRRHHGINLTEMLAYNLRHAGGPTTSGGYGGYVILQFDISGRKESVKVKYFHGAGGGGPVTKGVIQSNRHAVKWPDGDIVFCGHIHEAWNLDIGQERMSNQAVLSHALQSHIVVPGYKADYGDGAEGFEVERDGQVKPVGCYWLHLKFRDRRKRGLQSLIKVTPIKDTEAW